MSISDAQYADWLEDPTARRVTLYEVDVVSGGVPQTRYISNVYYGGGSPDTPYLCLVAPGGDPDVTQSISLESGPALTATDLLLANPDGSLDSWLLDVFRNRGFRAFHGDVTWTRADFRQIFTGVNQGLDGSRSPTVLALKLRNILQRLNTPVTDVKMGAPSPTPDALVPVALGECPNVLPPLCTPNTLEFQFHGGAAEMVIEARVDGKPRVITPNVAAGKFSFPQAINGSQVTCDIQGDKVGGVYSNTISKLVQRLVTGYGKASMRFLPSELDTASLAAFDVDHPQPVGLWLTERTNVLVACDQLASSVGAQLVPTATGLLRLVQFTIPTAASVELRQSQQIDQSIEIVGTTDVVSAVKLGYCRRWTVQPNLRTSINPEHQALFAQEWPTVTASDAAVRAAYLLDDEPVQEDTCLLTQADALVEANRRLALRKVPRTTYRFDGSPGMFLVEVGQAVKLFSERFNLSAGKFGLVSSRTVNLGTLAISLEVTV
jgi:hypothetical protein